MLLLVSTLHILALLIQNPMVYNVVILIGQMRLTIAGSHVVRERQGWGSGPGGLTLMGTVITCLAVQPLQ